MLDKQTGNEDGAFLDIERKKKKNAQKKKKKKKKKKGRAKPLSL